MKLTVLGASGSFPGPDRACSGYLLDTGSTRLVVDLGWGTATRLFSCLGNHTGDGLDCVVITHEHPDHMGDLYALFRARWYMRRESPPIRLVAHEGVLTRLELAHDGTRRDLSRVFAWSDSGTEPTRVGDVEILSWLLPHYVPNLGIRIQCPDGVVAFSGDTGPSHDLAAVGRNADLFVVDATDRHQQPGVQPAPDGTPAFNLTAVQAGSAARDAEAKTLVLTHLWPGNDPEQALREARTTFGGDIVVAEDGMEIHI